MEGKRNRFMNEMIDDDILKYEKMIPRYQLIFSEYSPLMALDQYFQIDENSKFEMKIFMISREFYFRIETNLSDLFEKYKVNKNLENIKKVIEECKKYFLSDCYLQIIYNKNEIRKLQNPWYENEKWYKQRMKKYDNL